VAGANTASIVMVGALRILTWSLLVVGCANDGPVLGDAVRLVGGDYHTCALTTDGSVYCWGSNTDGTLGVPGPHESCGKGRDCSPRPLRVDLPATTEFHSGPSLTCVVDDLGVARCWGNNEAGLVGTGERWRAASPTTVPAPAPVTGLAIGDAHLCAALEDRTVWCAGDNAHGQLGNGTTRSSTVLAPVSGLDGVVAVVASRSQTCALAEDGDVFCWGLGIQSGFGLAGAQEDCIADYEGLQDCARSPQRIPGVYAVTDIQGTHESVCLNLRQGWLCPNAGRRASLVPRTLAEQFGALGRIGYGDSDGCVLDLTGGVHCWHEFNHVEFPITPVTVSNDALDLTVGFGHICIVAANGDVACWGNNDDGQLGDGKVGGITDKPRTFD
jgi:hypothetical protein